MTYTRAASAASSHRAKQELVRLLFGPKYFRRGPEAHRMLDHSIYTHSQLKSAYLQRVQELHPDKRRHESTALNLNSNTNQGNFDGQESAKDEFISLQQAWRQYEEFAKALSRVENGSREADFTMFGVGCSFSDNEDERAMRSEITDQACRGWFAAGQIGVGSDDNNNNDDDASTTSPKLRRGRVPGSSATSLLDEDMFIKEQDVATNRQDNSPEVSNTTVKTTKRKTLVDHMMRPKRGSY